MNIVELILIIIVGGFAGYGLAAWEEDRKLKKDDLLREIMKGLHKPIWRSKK